MRNGSSTAGDVSPAPGPPNIRTILALFDDTIDTELALGDLRRAKLPPEQISAMLREQVIDMDRPISNQTMLSRVVGVSALDTVSGWLRGLLTLVLSDRAAYLVAGPIGVSLASGHDEIRKSIWQDWTNASNLNGVDLTTGQLARALTEFGVALDEAAYIEQRVVAGSTLIAVTSADVGVLRQALNIFTKRTAVHVGVARTTRSMYAMAAELLVTGPQAGNSSVVVADAISPLRHVLRQSREAIAAFDLIGLPLLTPSGVQLGTVIDALIEVSQTPHTTIDPTSATVRYLIASHHSMFMLRRRTIAVPRDAVDATGESFVLRDEAIDIRQAPRYSPVIPLSRQQEVRIRQFFNAPHYWRDESAAPEPTTSRDPDQAR